MTRITMIARCIVAVLAVFLILALVAYTQVIGGNTAALGFATQMMTYFIVVGGMLLIGIIFTTDV